MIPQCDPKKNYLKYKKEIDSAILNVLEGGKYVLGDEVSLFESEFAKFNSSLGAVGVANGTDAIKLALMALDSKEKEKVVTVSHTAVATVNAISSLGLQPLFVDVDEDSFNMSPKQLDEVLSSHHHDEIRAVIFVHIYGNTANIDAVSSICKKYNISLIEDCAQAHGSEFNKKKVGNHGIMGTFSFYPTKNLGAIGDGGAIVCNDDEILKKLKYLREYGWTKRYISEYVGCNSRLDEIQASILRVKLKYLERDIDLRRKIAYRYLDEINCSHVLLPAISREVKHAFHQFVIRTPRREKLQKLLFEKEIFTGVHYPLPVHMQPAYASLKFQVNKLTNTEVLYKQILSLPMFPELSTDQVSEVIRTINLFK